MCLLCMQSTNHSSTLSLVNNWCQGKSCCVLYCRFKEPWKVMTVCFYDFMVYSLPLYYLEFQKRTALSKMDSSDLLVKYKRLVQTKKDELEYKYNPVWYTSLLKHYIIDQLL